MVDNQHSVKGTLLSTQHRLQGQDIKGFRTVLHKYKQAGGARVDTDEQVRHEAKSLSVASKLRLERLRHVSTIWRNGPASLVALLQAEPVQEGGWKHAVLADLEVLFEAFPAKIAELGPPSATPWKWEALW